MFTYLSDDEGNKSKMKASFPPHRLHLKVGCPVILLQNLSDDLCNGLNGLITKLDEDGPTVLFKRADISMKMTKKIFFRYIIIVYVNI